MENIESITEEKVVKQPFFSYRGVAKCYSAGISFVTANWLFFVKVFSPLFAIGGLAFALMQYLTTSKAILSQVTSFGASIVYALNLAIVAGMICRLFVQESLEKGFLGYNTISLFKASRKQINKGLAFILLELVVVLVSFSPAIAAFVYLMKNLTMATPSLTDLAILGGVLILNVVIVLFVIAVPMTMVMPYMLMEKSNAFKNAWKGFKKGYSIWGKCFGLVLLLAITIGLLMFVFMLPAAVMISISQAAEASRLMGDPVDLPMYFSVLFPVVLFFSGYVMMFMQTIAITSAFYLYASVKADEKEQGDMLKVLDELK